MQNLVTAIITTHNRKSLVIRAISSILHQTYNNIEIIVVDDASTDGTRNLVEETFKNRSFTYIFIKNSRGGNYARNIGIKNAHGKYVAFLDDDDEWLEKKIEKQVDFLEKHVDYACVSCSRIMEFDYSRTELIPDSVFPKNGDMSKTIWSCNALVSSTLMFRTDFIQSIGNFDEDLVAWQDYELLLRTAQKTYIGVLQEPLVLYRCITTDKGRLTNRMTKWEKAIDYILLKHRYTFDLLPISTKNKFLKLVALDGYSRACTNRSLIKKLKYLYRLFVIEPSIKSFVRIFYRLFIS